MQVPVGKHGHGCRSLWGSVDHTCLQSTFGVFPQVSLTPASVDELRACELTQVWDLDHDLRFSFIAEPCLLVPSCVHSGCCDEIPSLATPHGRTGAPSGGETMVPARLPADQVTEGLPSRWGPGSWHRCSHLALGSHVSCCHWVNPCPGRAQGSAEESGNKQIAATPKGCCFSLVPSPRPKSLASPLTLIRCSTEACCLANALASTHGFLRW